MWHATQGNMTGAVSVMSRAVDYLEPFHPAREGFDVAGLSASLEVAIAACRDAQATGTPPELPIARTGLHEAKDAP
jgi:hypothetical protein